MADKIVPVKGLIKVAYNCDGYDLDRDGSFTLASPAHLHLRDVVKYCLDRDSVPVTPDDQAALQDRLNGDDFSWEYTQTPGLLHFQTVENGKQMMRLVKPDIDLWKELLPHIPESQNYVDLSVRDGIGQKLLDMSGSSFLVPKEDIVLPFANGEFQDNCEVRRIFPDNADRYVSSIKMQYPKVTHGRICYSRSDLEKNMVRVGSFGVVLYDSDVVAGDYFSIDGRARGKLPVVAKK